MFRISSLFLNCIPNFCASECVCFAPFCNVVSTQELRNGQVRSPGAALELMVLYCEAWVYTATLGGSIETSEKGTGAFLLV